MELQLPSEKKPLGWLVSLGRCSHCSFCTSNAATPSLRLVRPDHIAVVSCPQHRDRPGADAQHRALRLALPLPSRSSCRPAAGRALRRCRAAPLPCTAVPCLDLPLLTPWWWCGCWTGGCRGSAAATARTTKPARRRFERRRVVRARDAAVGGGRARGCAVRSTVHMYGLRPHRANQIPWYATLCTQRAGEGGWVFPRVFWCQV